MLSILIPTYNYNIFPLAAQIENLAIKSGVAFEILCMDDGSNSETNIENQKINTLKHSLFTSLDFNIGRSKIRNLLASKANYDWLLFLDADVIPVNNSFIEKYLEAINKQTEIIYGGILYEQETPSDNQILRWSYGKKREALSKKDRDLKPYLRFLTLNFLIHKSVFEKVSFNENIPNLRHEDTLFALDLKQHKINMAHLNNPVYHLGLETNKQFLEKSLQSVKAISLFIDQGLINYHDTFITKVYFYCQKTYLNRLLKHLYLNTKIRAYFENQLYSRKPSLFLFDIYRLGYFCSLNSKK